MNENLMSELAAEAAAAPPVSQSSLESIKTMGDRAVEIDARVQELLAEMETLEEEQKEILTRRMPEAMDAANVPDITIGGLFFECLPYYHASISEKDDDPESMERAARAYDWLESDDVGAGDIIKRSVRADFPKEFEKEAQELMRFITERYQMATVQMKRGVPWASLTKWLKEHFAAGNEPPAPLEDLGATVGRVVKIKAVDGERRRKKKRR